MKASHTPGPWSLEKDGLPELNNQNNIVYGSDGIAIVYGQANDADARLIAAAPDLLESLKFMLTWGHCSAAHIKAHAAIARATGEKS